MATREGCLSASLHQCWSAPIHHATNAVAALDVLGLSSSDSTKYEVATVANRIANRGEMHGVSLDSAVGGGAVRLQIMGPLPRGMMGAGPRSGLVVSAQGRLIRGSTGLIVGWTDTAGNGFVNFAAASMGMASDHVNICAAPYGLIADESSAAVRAHNRQVLQDAIDDTDADDLTCRGRRLFIPRGDYYFDNTIYMRRTVQLYGEGGVSESGATRLLFPDGVTGIVSQFYLVYPSGVAGFGDWAAIQDLVIRAEGKTIPGAVGIRAYCRMNLTRVCVYGFSSHGVRIDAGVGIPAEGNYTNANFGRMDTCRFVVNGGFGCSIFDGSDNSGWVLIGCDGSGNTLGDFEDDSYFGNQYFGCSANSENGVPRFAVSGTANHSGLFGCYAENSTEYADVTGVAAVFGGNLSALGRFKLSNTGAFFGGQGSMNIYAEREGHFRAWIDYNNNTAHAIKWATNAAPHGWTRSSAVAGAPAGVTLRSYSDSYADWAFGYSDEDYVPGHFYTGRGVTLVRVLRLGDFASGHVQDTGTAPPGVGDGARTRGDFRWNLTPSAGGNIGWSCVESGSPGVWKAVGGIAA